MKHFIVERHVIFEIPHYFWKNERNKDFPPNWKHLQKIRLEKMFRKKKFYPEDVELFMDMCKIYKTLNKMEEF